MADQADREIQELYSEWIDHPSPLVCTRLAERLRSVDRADEALEVAKQGAEEWPEHLSILVVLGKIHLDKGELDAASSSLDSVRAKDPFNVFALKGLAEVGFKREDWDACIELLEEYLLENPGDEEMEEMLSSARLRRKGGDAEARLSMTSGDEMPSTEEEAGASILEQAFTEQPETAESDSAEDAPAEFPDTERMARILSEQGVDVPSVQSGDKPEGETPAATSDPSATVQGGSRQPRSLLDLFSEDEKAELGLEPYESGGEAG
jgi:tetratricopeptide (TPR) repeat protein